MANKVKKEKAPPEPFFNELIEVYFDFCREKFNQSPLFDGSAPRDFKAIVSALRKRAEATNIEWNDCTSTRRLYNFLSYCYQDEFIRKNFLLHIINRQKEKLFFNIQSDKLTYP